MVVSCTWFVVIYWFGRYSLVSNLLMLFRAFGCLAKQVKHLAQNLGLNAFRKWTRLYDRTLSVLASAYFRFSRFFKQKKQISRFADAPRKQAVTCLIPWELASLEPRQCNILRLFQCPDMEQTQSFPRSLSKDPGLLKEGVAKTLLIWVISGRQQRKG